MNQTCPTADEVARIIIAASRMVGADPAKITAQLPQGRPPEYLQRISCARGYTALALHRLFPALGSSSISRMVGATSKYAGEIFRDIHRGNLRWYDETDFRAILTACGVSQRERVQIVIDETVHSYATPPEPPKPAPPSVRFGSKARLEDELRRAVENTARMQRADEGEVR